jgi:predicted ArsR family transcriptional regulator
MESTKFGQIFFESTRGKIVSRLRHGACTVEQLAQEIGLTDNAVRAHLATLERDGLIERGGLIAGLRKPHVAYRLTNEAGQLFPKAYHTLLNELLVVLKQELDSEKLQVILRKVARRLAADRASNVSDESLESRAARAVAVMHELGGVAIPEIEGDSLLIRSGSGCPFADTVSEHPEICQLAETLLSEIMGLQVREHCQKGSSPQCTFEVSTENRA